VRIVVRVNMYRARPRSLDYIERSKRITARIICLLFFSLVPSFAQTDNKPGIMDPFKYFIGSWEGQSKGEMGIGKSYREYKYFLSGSYLEVRNKSVHAPQEKNAKGSLHEDFGIISFDQARKRFIFRQFHVEGFVNQYVLSFITPDDKAWIWQTESIENMLPGWRAKETHKIISKDEFVELFELAPPGKEFFTFAETTFKRKPWKQ
jgi:hypothetical protein